MHEHWKTPGNPELCGTTHSWMPLDTMENWLARGRPSIYAPESFDYRYNEHGFRCDAMWDAQGHPHRVLWVGCSITEGIGLPVHATWGHILSRRLAHRLSNDAMPYWCVARGGVSQDYLARQLTMVIPLVRPKAVVITLPDPSRREIWHRGVLHHWVSSNDHFLDRKILDVWDDDQIIHDSLKALLLIHMTCMAYGAAYWWRLNRLDLGPESSWVTRSIVNGLPSDVRGRMLARGHFSHEDDFARDGRHPGPLAHADYAGGIWDEIGDDLLASLR